MVRLTDIGTLARLGLETGRYFVVSDRAEIEENEFNLNLPRYVDTFEPEEEIDLNEALQAFTLAEDSAKSAAQKLLELLKGVGCAG